jgi:hypothetical protein
MPDTLPPLLSEQQIIDALGHGGWTMLDDARAIESATRAPLLERIGELEAENATLMTCLAECRNAVFEAFPDLAWSEAMAAVGGPEEVPAYIKAAVGQLRAQVAATTQPAPASQEPVHVMREGCNYTAEAGVICNKCGHVHRATTEQPSQAGEVVQFRTRLCSDWYDGYPDNEDGGGPYETRTLYTAPSKPVPMTPEQAYDLFGVGYQMSIIRAVEARHHITSKGE